MINLKVILPIGIKIDDEFDHVVIPGSDGDFGVSKGHTPLITNIRPGVLVLYKGNSKELFSIHDGFVTVEDDEIIITSEILEKKNEINYDRALKAKKRAEKRLNSADESIDYRRAELSLKKAIARLDTKEY